jgi:hypothetical protein
MQNGRMLESLMSMMQNAIGGFDGFNHDQVTDFGLQSNLYQLQKDSETLLPDFHLNRGEVRKVSHHAVATSSTGLDIYEGVYVSSAGCNQTIFKQLYNNSTVEPRESSDQSPSWCDLQRNVTEAL